MDDADLIATRPGTNPAGETGFVPPERYVLIDQLGEGGMGTVWAAHDKVLDRTVALKVLHDRFLGAEDQARLEAEARAMARLSHRNVIAVYDVAAHDGRTYVTMELVRGIHLGHWLEQPRTWREIVAVFRAAGSGLAAAHAAGIVHRDIKPSNILVGEAGEVRVADFGVAHSSRAFDVDPGANPTAETVGLIGTLVYMSPAQLRSEPADARGDQFAFFVTLYEALHGRRPFEGATVAALCEAIERGCPPPVRDVPRWLHAAVVRGVAPDPAARFPSMAAANAALAGPSRRTWWVLGGVGILSAATVAVYASARGGSACPDPARELDGVWDEAARVRGREAFAKLGFEYAPAAWDGVAEQLDQRAHAWTVSAAAACREDDRPRRACLDAHRAVLGALATRLGQPDRATLERSAEVFVELPSLSDCTLASYLPAVSLRPEGAAAADLAVARADLLVHPTQAGLDAAARARATAQAEGDPALQLAATLVHAQGQRALAHVGEADAELEATATAAGALGAWAVAVDARLARPGLDAAEAKRLLELAVSLGDPRRHALALLRVAEVAQRDGETTLARARLIEAAEVATIAHQGDAPWMVPVDEALAHAHLRAGAPDDALAVSKRLSDRTRAFGELHPLHGRALLIAGEVNLALGRRDKALAKATAALRIARAAFGDGSAQALQAQQLLDAIAAAAPLAPR